MYTREYTSFLGTPRCAPILGAPRVVPAGARTCPERHLGRNSTSQESPRLWLSTGLCTAKRAILGTPYWATWPQIGVAQVPYLGHMGAPELPLYMGRITDFPRGVLAGTGPPESYFARTRTARPGPKWVLRWRPLGGSPRAPTGEVAKYRSSRRSPDGPPGPHFGTTDLLIGTADLRGFSLNPARNPCALRGVLASPSGQNRSFGHPRWEAI